MMDKVFALIGLTAMIAFMGIVTVKVMEPDLWIVTLAVLSVAIYFILQDLKAGGSHLEGEAGDEEPQS